MLIVKIHYGLGNQLFQYALARSLSLRKGTAFALDTSFFTGPVDKENPRVYQLDRFNIREQLAAPAQIDAFLGLGFFQRRWRNLLEKGKPYHKKKVVYEAGLDFDEAIFSVDDDAYLFGYWQDLRYFTAAADIVRKDLSFKQPPAGRNAELLSKLGSENAVSLHIRRGDYLTDTYTVDNVGICDLGYYHRAVEEIAAAVASPVFYIFSDDQQWAKENFHIDHPVIYVDHNNQENAFEDLRLMAACRHQVLANSSFSWWGAWLNPNPEKIVIAPRVWRSKGPVMYLPKPWKTL